MGKKDKSGSKPRDGKARIDMARVGALEVRLQRLETLLAGPGSPVPAQQSDIEAEDEGAGRLRLELRGVAPGWRRDCTIAGLMAADWPGCAARLAALGHPMRLAILRRALDGPLTAAGLQDGLAGERGLVSSGRLYHHLRELTATGWLLAEGRGRFVLSQDRTGPLLAALATALAD